MNEALSREVTAAKLKQRKCACKLLVFIGMHGASSLPVVPIQRLRSSNYHTSGKAIGHD